MCLVLPFLSYLPEAEMKPAYLRPRAAITKDTTNWVALKQQKFILSYVLEARNPRSKYWQGYADWRLWGELFCASLLAAGGTANPYLSLAVAA